MKHFQLHGLNYIFPFAEPENKFVAFLHTFSCQTYPVIKVCQLIGPFFPVIPLFEFLKDCNPFLQPHVLRFVQLVLEHISAAVIGGYLDKILIILDSLYHFSHLDRKITERINNHSPCGVAFVRHFQKQLRIVKSSVYLIKITDCAEHHHALHSCPVNGIRDLRSFHILLLRDQCLNFLCPYFVLIFIQGATSTVILIRHNYPLFLSFKFTIGAMSCQSQMPVNISFFCHSNTVLR